MHHLFAYCYVTESRERYHTFSCNLIFVHQNRNNVPTKIKIHVLDSIHLIGWALFLVYEHSGNAIVQRVKSCSVFPELISLAYSFHHSPRVVALFIALQSAAAKGVPSSTASPLPLVHTADVYSLHWPENTPVTSRDRVTWWYFFMVSRKKRSWQSQTSLLVVVVGGGGFLWWLAWEHREKQFTLKLYTFIVTDTSQTYL
jgi:hypothetical protein